MRTIFVTQNEMGKECLDELLSLGADVRRVYTKPSDPGVSDQAEIAPITGKYEVPLNYTESVNDPEIVEEMRETNPDFIFVIGWSEIVGEEVLSVPSTAALGMHPSPLPRGRGRAPIAWSIIKGLEDTALSFFHLVEEADAGNLVTQKKINIEIEDEASDLYDKVISAGRELIRENYPDFEEGRVPRSPQDESRATWWPKRVPRHGIIDWNQSAEEVYNWIRGQTHPYPGAFSYIEETKITVWGAEPPEKNRCFAKPGELLETNGDNLRIAVWEESIELTHIQVEDGEEEPAASLVTEHGFETGDVFRNLRDLVTSP